MTMQRHSRSAAQMIGAAVLVIGLAAGCSSAATSGASSAPASTTSSTASPTHASPTPTASPTRSGTESGGACASSQLSASLGQADGAAGSSYIPLVLTNTGAPCVIEGYPGVSLAAAGSQIGAAADRDETTAPTPVTLATGASATATIRVVQAGNFDAAACSPTQVDSLVVYPPNQTEALTIPGVDYTGCASSDVHVLTVSAFQAEAAN